MNYIRTKSFDPNDLNHSENNFQLRQYVPDENVVGHSASIRELDVESDDDEEYILVSKLERF